MAPPPKRPKTDDNVFLQLEDQLPDELMGGSGGGNVPMGNGPSVAQNQLASAQSHPSSMPSAASMMPHPPTPQNQHKNLTQLLQSGHNSPKYVQTPSPANNAISSPRPPRQPSQPQPSPLSTSHNSMQSPSAGSMVAAINSMKSPPGSLPRPNSRPGSAINATPSPRPGNIPGGPMSVGSVSVSGGINTSLAPASSNSLRSPMTQNQLQQQNMMAGQGQVMHSGVPQGMQKYMSNGPSRPMQSMVQQGVNPNMNRPNMQNVMNMGHMPNQQGTMAHYNNQSQPHMQQQVSPMNQMPNSVNNFGQQQQSMQFANMPNRQMTMNNPNSVFNSMSAPRPRQGLMTQANAMASNRMGGVSVMGPSGMQANNVNIQMMQQQGNVNGTNTNMAFNQMPARAPSGPPVNNIQMNTQQQQISRLASQLDHQTQNMAAVSMPPMQNPGQAQMQQHMQSIPQSLGQANTLSQPPGGGGPGPPPNIGQSQVNAGQPGASGTNAPADPEKRRLIQQQLVLLLHAYKCAKKEHNGEAPNCTLPHCRTMKEVLRHMNVCTQGKSCQVAHCASSRQIIAHWRACNRHDCVVCLPLKSVPNNNNPAVPGSTGMQQQRWANPGMGSAVSATSTTDGSAPPYAGQMTDPMLAGANLQPNNPNLPAGLAGLPNGLAGISQESTSQAPDANMFHAAPRVKRDWHKDVTEELRNHLVQKLVQAIFPTPQKVSLADERMKKLVTFARKVEGDMYEQANSRSEYYHLLAEKIYKIQKELEEKRAQRVQKRPNSNNPRMPMVNGPMNAMTKTLSSMEHFLAGPGVMPGPNMTGSQVNPSGVGQQLGGGPMVRPTGMDGMLVRQAPASSDFALDPMMMKFQKATDVIRKNETPPTVNNQAQGMQQLHSGPGLQNSVGMGNANNGVVTDQQGMDNFSQRQQGKGMPQSGAVNNVPRPPSAGQLNPMAQRTAQGDQTMRPQLQTAQPRLESLLRGTGTPPSSNQPASNSLMNNLHFDNHAQQQDFDQRRLQQNQNELQTSHLSHQPSSLQEMLQGGPSNSIAVSTTTTTLASVSLTNSLNSSTTTTVSASSPSPFVSKPRLSNQGPSQDVKLEVNDSGMPFSVPSSNAPSYPDSVGKEIQVKSQPMQSAAEGSSWSPSSSAAPSKPIATSTSVTTVSVEGAVKMETSESYPASSTSGTASNTTTLSPFVKQENLNTSTPSSNTSIVPKMKCPAKVFDPLQLKVALMPVVEKLYHQEPEAIPFRQPVDPEKLHIPDYFDIVKEPMDLASIRENLEAGKYKEPWEFMSDIWLMFNNAWLYNRRTTRVYKYCSKLKEIFEVEIDPVMQSLGYCCGRKMEFMPMTLCCYGKQLCTIPTGAVYYEYQNRYDYCEKCFNEIPGDSISLADDPSKPQSAITTIPKSQFEKKKNDVLDPEPFETCQECGRKMHKICVLHMSPIWPEGFTCDGCLAARNAQRKPNRYLGAKLPQNKLSEHIERRVNNYIKRHDTNGESGHVHIRVVYSGDKTVEVRSGMKARFVDTKEMPETFPYRAKAFFAFEEIDGVDVCFFGVHVQEYGSDAPKPNQRRVYLSYLDSVHFFRPRHLRTAVYHEILIGYFEYCRNLGYEFAHIWACPPCEGDDYIFHCHPPEQKIPKPKRLQDWYKKMLDKAISEQVIVEYKDIFHQAKEDRLQSARELPYFEGDFWPNVLEESIKEIEQEEEDRKQAEANEQAAAEESDQGSGTNSKNGKNKKSKKASSKKASQRTTKKKLPQVTNDLSDKLYQTMEKHKEVFFVIRLNSVETISKAGPTTDPDTSMQCDLMDGRDAFLTLAREKHFEFSSLRRAKWSTMAMLVELHTQGQDKFSYMCNHCRNNVETRYQCTVCHDFDLCVSCYQLIGHEHEMDKMGFGLDDGSNGSPGSNSMKKSPHIPVERCMQSLVHACQCRNANCTMASCLKMKKVVQHAKTCKKKTNGTCPICKQLIALCCYHAKHCQEKKCPVAFCYNIKNKLKQQELQHRVQQAYLMRRRMKVMRRNITQAGPNTPSAGAPGTPQQVQPSPKPQMTPDHHNQQPQPSPMTGGQEMSQMNQGKMNIGQQHGMDTQGSMVGHQSGGMMPMHIGNPQTPQHMNNSQQQYVRNGPVTPGMSVGKPQGQMGLASPLGGNQQQSIMSPSQQMQTGAMNRSGKFPSPPPEAAVRAAKQAQQLADQQAKERERLSKYVHPQSNPNQMVGRSMNQAVPRVVNPVNVSSVNWPGQMQTRPQIRPLMQGQAPNMAGGPQPMNPNNGGGGLMINTGQAPGPGSNEALKQMIGILKQDQPGQGAGRPRMKSSEQLMAFLKTNPQLMSSIIKQRKAQNKQNQQKQVLAHGGMQVAGGNVQQSGMGSGSLQQMVMQNQPGGQPVMNMQSMQSGMGNPQQMQWQQQQQQQRRMAQQAQFQQPAPPYSQAVSQQRMMNVRMQQQPHRMQLQIRHQMNQGAQSGMGMQQGVMGQPGVQSAMQHHPGMMNPGQVTQVAAGMTGQPVQSSRPTSQPMQAGRVAQMPQHHMAGGTTQMGQVVNQGPNMSHMVQPMDQQFNPSGAQPQMMMGGFNHNMNSQPRYDESSVGDANRRRHDWQGRTMPGAYTQADPNWCCPPDVSSAHGGEDPARPVCEPGGEHVPHGVGDGSVVTDPNDDGRLQP